MARARAERPDRDAHHRHSAALQVERVGDGLEIGAAYLQFLVHAGTDADLLVVEAEGHFLAVDLHVDFGTRVA